MRGSGPGGHAVPGLLRASLTLFTPLRAQSLSSTRPWQEMTDLRGALLFENASMKNTERSINQTPIVQDPESLYPCSQGGALSSLT